MSSVISTAAVLLLTTDWSPVDTLQNMVSKKNIMYQILQQGFNIHSWLPPTMTPCIVLQLDPDAVYFTELDAVITGS